MAELSSRGDAENAGMRSMIWTRVAKLLRDRTHEMRADLFVRLMGLRGGERLLDLGGGDGSLAARVVRRVEVRVVVADIGDARLLARARYGFEEVELPRDGGLPFDDAEFDVVLCNSVIEHVTLPKPECHTPGMREWEWRERSLAAQHRFAREIHRVGRGYFVQTPHRAFPIDAHTWLPLTNFLPHDAARRLVRMTDRVWLKKCGVADWHLLGAVELRSLFPGAELHIERFAGLPRSIIAYHRA